jgi:hypothetical protein
MRFLLLQRRRTAPALSSGGVECPRVSRGEPRITQGRGPVPDHLCLQRQDARCVGQYNYRTGGEFGLHRVRGTEERTDV